MNPTTATQPRSSVTRKWRDEPENDLDMNDQRNNPFRSLGPELRAITGRLKDLLRLSLDRAAVHATDPDRYPLDVTRASIERAALTYIERLAPERRRKLDTRMRRWLDDARSPLHRRTARWSGFGLDDRTPILARPAAKGHLEAPRLSPTRIAEALRMLRSDRAVQKPTADLKRRREFTRPALAVADERSQPIEVAERLAYAEALEHFRPTSIEQRYIVLGGGSGELGAPTSPETVYRGGRIRRYENGIIVWSETTGAWEITGSILDKWEDMEAVEAANFPVNAAFSVSGGGLLTPGGRFQGFERVIVTEHAQHGTWAVRIGPVVARWLDRAQSSDLGYPVADEEPIPGGVAQSFVGGRIFWSIDPETGLEHLADVHGPIFVKYEALRREGSDSGSAVVAIPRYPQADERTIFDGTVRVQSFDNLTITWSEDAGAHAVWGPAEDFLLDELERPLRRGWNLGIPIRDIEYRPGGQRAWVRCEHGAIFVFWDRYDQPQVFAFDEGSWNLWLSEDAEYGSLGLPFMFAMRGWGTYRAELQKPEWFTCDDDDRLTAFEGGYIHQEATGALTIRRAFETLRCRLTRVRCGHETAPAGTDEFGVGGVVVGPDLQVRRFGPTRVGDFITGIDRPVSVSLWDFDVARAGWFQSWPKSCLIQIVPYEDDDGNFVTFLADYQQEVVDAIISVVLGDQQLTAADQALLMQLFGTTDVTSLGGGPVAAAMAAAASVLVEWSNEVLEDEVFPVVTMGRTVPTLLYQDIWGLIPPETHRVDGHGGWYEIDVQWSIS